MTPRDQTNVPDRYARQRLIPSWNQEALAAATILVAGAGALGNEVIKNLALLGVGHVLILDRDRIEESNLSRTVLFRPADVGAWKAQVAATAARAMNPAMRVTEVVGDIRRVLGLGRVHRCTLVLGCLDNQGARLLLNRMCMAAGVPYLDGAMWAMGGEVRAFLDVQHACFDCTLSPAERTHLWVRYSCSGGLQPADEAAMDAAPAATTITTTAIIAGILTQEAVRLMCGELLPSGSALVYNGVSGKLFRTTLRRDPQCQSHSPVDWADVRPLHAPAAAITARAVLLRAQPDLDGLPVLDLGRDLLGAFVCPTCGTREERGLPAWQVPAAEATCPTCGTSRTSEMVSSVTLDDPMAAWTLAQLGIPDGEVISVRGHEMVVSFEVLSDE